MKRMLLVIVTMIVIAAMGVSVFDQIHYAQRKGYTLNCAHQGPPSSASESLVCVADNHQEYDAGKPYPPPWNVFLAWPEGITALLLAFTLVGISWQAWETRKSAKAAAESANAAYGSLTFAEAQLDLMREKERARLELNVQRTNLDVEVAGDDLVHLIAIVSVRNIGASKAFIGRTSGTLITRLRNEALGDNEDYSPLDLPEQVIAPDKPFVPSRVYCFSTTTARTFAECLEEGTFTLHFFGFIEYESLGFWRRKEFGYDWKILDRNSSLAGMLGLSDPYPNSPRSSKDRISYGYWQPNEDMDKPEYPISANYESESQNSN